MLKNASFGVEFEGNQIPKPIGVDEESLAKWSETEFVSFDQYADLTAEGKWVVLLVTESGEMYRKEQIFDVALSEEKGIETNEMSSTLHKLDSFTGQITFGAYLVTKGDSDYSLFYKATFHNGKFEKVELLSQKANDNSNRKDSLDELNKKVIKRIKIEKNVLYKYLYAPYKGILILLYGIIAYLWLLPLRILGWLVGKLTPI